MALQSTNKAEIKARWNYYTDKIILVLKAVTETQGDMQLIWARHASALMKKRDKYREEVE